MPAETPRLRAPAHTCDCAIHIYDAAMPVAATALSAGPAWADVAAYRTVQARLGLARTIIVQPTSYGTDNRCTEHAIAALGRERTRGVAVVDDQVGEAELQRLTEAGFCGVRFQMFPGGALPWEMLEPVAAKVAGFGWHVQLQMDGRLLPEREAMLKRLPTPLVIDHCGKFLEPVTLDHPGFGTLIRLLDGGRTWMKLSGAYEVSRAGPPLYGDIGALAKAAAISHPERMVWGSNWPHVGVSPDDAPDDAALLDLMLDWVPDEQARHRILVDNPAALYGFDAA